MYFCQPPTHCDMTYAIEKTVVVFRYKRLGSISSWYLRTHIPYFQLFLNGMTTMYECEYTKESILFWSCTAR